MEQYIEIAKETLNYITPSILVIIVLFQWFVLEKFVKNVQNVITSIFESINKFVLWMTSKKAKIIFLVITIVYILVLIGLKYLL